MATIFVNERQRDWVNFTHQRGLPIFSGTMGCWIFSIFTRFNMFLRFYQQLSNQWYWRAPCTWRHWAKILFQQFIYPPIWIQIFIVCSLLLCQTSDLNVFSIPFFYRIFTIINPTCIELIFDSHSISNYKQNNKSSLSHLTEFSQLN